MAHREDAFLARQHRAPLFEALIHHVKRRPHSFHVPGHKAGTSFDGEAKELFQHILPLDLTEITGLDDLHQPAGVIQEAQTLAAEAYGAEETRFLVGGTTVGNIASIMAVCKPGDKILIQRNSHKSIYNSIVLARATPVYVVPALDPQTGVAAGVRREDVERALHEHPDVKAVFLTNPTYYGMGIDLHRMAQTVHRFDIPLIIDEAHGAHYGFHPALPVAAMQAGADIAVQSTHKMGVSMTMSSMLHVQGKRIDRDRLYRSLAMLQSSSPSYPLLASLDTARRHMVLEGAKEIERMLAHVESFRDRMRRLSWLYLPKRDEYSVYATLDPLKWLLSLRTKKMTGYQLQQMLEAKGIYSELADTSHILLVASLGTTHDDVEALIQALEHISPDYHHEFPTFSQAGVLTSSFLHDAALPMHDAMDRRKKPVALESATGKICGEMVIPYPPGIPLLVPGERIDKQAVALIREYKASKVRFHGVQDQALHTIQIIL